MRSISKVLKVGITGGIGAGKSLAARVFMILGVPVYDSDSRARGLMNSSPFIKEKILRAFGADAYVNGQLDREVLAQIVFKNPDKLQQLNAIVHPAVAEDFREWASAQVATYVVQEAALIFEVGSQKRLDKVILVTAPEDLRVKRVLERDPHRSADGVKDIMSRQWSEEQKKELANYVIANDESSLLIPQVLKIHEALTTLSLSGV